MIRCFHMRLGGFILASTILKKIQSENGDLLIFNGNETLAFGRINIDPIKLYD